MAFFARCLPSDVPKGKFLRNIVPKQGQTKFLMYLQGLNFRAGWWNLEIPLKKITMAGDSRPEKFSIFWKLLLL